MMTRIANKLTSLSHLTLTLLVAGLATVCCAAEPSSAPIPWKSLRIPQALVVVGPWGDLFRWNDALHEQGLFFHDAYRRQNVYHGPFIQLTGMPETAEGYFNYSVIVLANIDAQCLGPERLAVIRRFVDQGGGLVVLGGSWAFGRGGYEGTVLAEMLPVTFPLEYRIPFDTEGLPLKQGVKASWPLSVDWSSAPRPQYVHKVSPKPDATVEVMAGEQPAIVSGRFGQGRVVACALTAHGESTPEARAYWEWAGWPKVLGQACEWAGGDRPLEPSDKIPATIRPLAADDIEQVRLQFQPLSEDFLKRFAAHPSAAAATAVFEEAFGSGRSKLSLNQEIVDGLCQFARPEWQTALVKNADALNPDRAMRKAALELLGATRVAKVAPTLLAALEDEDVSSAAAAGLRRLGDPANIPVLRRVFQQSVELSDFRNPDGAKSTGPPATRHGQRAVAAAIALYGLGDTEGVSRLVDLYREIHFLRRVFANAAKRRVSSTDATGINILKAIIQNRDDMRQLETLLLAAAGPIPENQHQAFARYAAETVDDDGVRWLATALLETPGNWSDLANAKDGIIRRLASTPGR